MSKLSMNSIKNFNLGALSLLSVVVVAFGIATAFSLVGKNPYLQRASNGERVPASIMREVVSFGEIEKLKNVVQTVNIGCVKFTHLKLQEVIGKQVRLVGEHCFLGSKGHLKAVANRTNGVNGTSFLLPEGKGFSTDYMFLEKGKNKLLLEFESDSGQHHMAEITLNRATIQEPSPY